MYIANFVLDNYGEGAIFGCPAHDERDFDFAKKYKLPILKVIECNDDQLPYTGDGIVINSPILNGLSKNKAINKIIEYFENQGIGENQLTIRLEIGGVVKDIGAALSQLFIMKMEVIAY